MYEFKKNGKVFTSKFDGTGPSSYEKRIYRAAVSQRLRNNAVGYPLFLSNFNETWIFKTDIWYNTQITNDMKIRS